MMTEPERATLHVLAGLAEAKVTPHIRWRDGTVDTIDFAALRDDCYSSGETVLCDVANDIWNAKGDATVASILCILDDGNLRRVLEAIAMCRGYRRCVTGR